MFNKQTSQFKALPYDYTKEIQRIKEREDEFGALFIDLSKAFDCINLRLLIMELGLRSQLNQLFYFFLIQEIKQKVFSYRKNL